MTETIALHTRLAAGKEADYESTHATIPAALHAAIVEAGVTQWRIWRSDRELFHLVEVENYAAMRAALRDDPVNIAWQQTMAELLEVEDDYSGDDRGIRQVWALI